MNDSLRALSESANFKRTDIRLNIFKDCCIGELKMCNATGDFETGIKTVDEILSGLDEFELKINKEQEVRFFYHVAYIYFGAGLYNKALFWINKVLNDNENTLRQDLYSYARLFNLVIHFELGNFDLLEYITKSTQRYLHKRQRDYELEKVVIEYMRKLIRANNVIDRKELFIRFNEKLGEIIQDPGDQIVMRYFDFQKWIDSKIENASFAETIKRAI